MEYRYTGVIEAWKEELMHQRVQKAGLRGQDADDAMQELAIKLLEFQFDPARANGRTEQSVLACLFDRMLKSQRRKEARYRKHLAGYQDETGRDGAGNPAEAADWVPSVELSAALEESLAELSPLAQNICRLVAAGMSIQGAADELGVRWHAVQRELEAIRRKLAAHGWEPQE